MKILAIIVASIVNFSSLIYSLFAFLMIDSLREHPWIRPKLSVIEGKYSNIQHKIAITQLKDAQLYLAKKAIIFSMILGVCFLVTHHYDLKILTFTLTTVASIVFYFGASIFLGYRPLWVLKYIAQPYLKTALIILAFGLFELIFGVDIISSALDQLISKEELGPLSSIFSTSWSKLILLSLIPIFVLLMSFCILYIFSLPGFLLSSIVLSSILFFARFIDVAAPDKKLSLSCAIYIFLYENFKKLFDINN